MQQCHIEIVMMGSLKPDKPMFSFEKYSFHSPEISSLARYDYWWNDQKTGGHL